MSGAIAIFVKTPRLSPIKTRLAVTLGQKNAEAFHLASSSAVVSIIQSLSQQETVDSYYAVAEQSALTPSYWQELPCLWQGEGGLGERMAHIYETLLAQYDYVILVGADSPQMTVTELTKATTWLSNNKQQGRLAFAPSDDGGFWLFGGNCTLPQTIWTDVIYSQADTGQQFFNTIKPLAEVKQLACLRDVDEADDLLVLHKELINLPKPSQAQRRLVNFLETLGIKY